MRRDTIITPISLLLAQYPMTKPQQHPRTEALNKLMNQHKMTARQVGDLIGRKPHTVRCWRSAWEDRVIPEHTLEVLQLKLSRPRRRGAAA